MELHEYYTNLGDNVFNLLELYRNIVNSVECFLQDRDEDFIVFIRRDIEALDSLVMKLGVK